MRTMLASCAMRHREYKESEAALNILSLKVYNDWLES